METNEAKSTEVEAAEGEEEGEDECGVDEQLFMEVIGDLADKAEEVGAHTAEFTFHFPVDHYMAGAKVKVVVELDGFEDCDDEGEECDDEEGGDDAPAAGDSDASA